MILGIIGTALLVILVIAAQGIYRNWDVYRGRRSTYDAMATHFDEQHEINASFADDGQFKGLFGRLWWKWKKLSKPWEAFGPLSRFWWARFRVYPQTVFAIGGKGPWRIETDLDDHAYNDDDKYLWFPEASYCYLSRQQLWKRWHLQIQWPLFVAFHVYPKAADVLAPGEHTDRDGKLFYFYIGFKRDTDNYWFAVYPGRNWK